jgi:uncharacterized protein (TIGR02118 family)
MLSGEVPSVEQIGPAAKALRASRPESLRKYEVNKGPVATPAGPSGYHLIALLHFDDMAAVQKAFASAEGQATVADIPNFASGGADIFMFDTRQV